MSQVAGEGLVEGRRTSLAMVVDLDTPLPEALEIGYGQFLVVSGECRAENDRVEAVDIVADEAEERAELSARPPGVAFWQAVFLPRELVGRSVAVNLQVKLGSGRVIEQNLGVVACRDVEWMPAPGPDRADGNELVAICMATYEPGLDAFRRQVDSIRAQTYSDWICVVNDDGSNGETWARMQEVCAGDGRFRFFRNEENLGFYHNFESALKRVPDSAAYVAFSDQDDHWYADKLSRLVDVLQREDANLAYSDMRIVDSEGAEVAGTYWINRKNEYRDLKVVLVANTVTGAASVFRRDMLPYLIPFPPRVGDAFHDHWLACTAMSIGRIAYVDIPLYDYYQYGDSVIGHCDFVRFTLGQRIMSLARLCGRLCRPSVAGSLLRAKYTSALAIYRGECRRLRLIQETIRRRCRGKLTRSGDLRLFDGGIPSVARLLRLHLGVLVKGQTTDDAELRLAMGEAARIAERRRA